MLEIHRTGGIAAGREAEAGAVVGELHVHEEARAEDVVVFEFPETVERVQEFVERIEIPLIPEKAVVLIARRPGRPSDLLFRAVEIEERELVVLGRRPVHLRVRVLEERLVGRLVQLDDLDVLPAIGGPEP